MPLNDISNPALFLLGLGLTLTYFPWPNILAIAGWSTFATGAIETLFTLIHALLGVEDTTILARAEDEPRPDAFVVAVPHSLHYLQHILRADAKSTSKIVSTILECPSLSHPPGTEIPFESLVHQLVVEILLQVSLEYGLVGIDQVIPRREAYLSLFHPWNGSTPGWQALDTSVSFREFAQQSGRLFGLLLYPSIQACHNGSLLVDIDKSVCISNIMERGSALFVATTSRVPAFPRDQPYFHSNPAATFNVDLETGFNILALELAEFNRIGGTWFKSLTRITVDQVLQKWDIVAVEDGWVARMK